jgi:2-hydroxychromene-2-carboxylate isomerase
VIIEATLYTDAACPWAYSASPALHALRWRYREQLSWRLVMIGLRDDVTKEAAATYDPVASLAGRRMFRDLYGMPFALVPKPRPSATGRGCRAVVAARLLDPGSEWRVFRALQFANFTTALMLDDDEGIVHVLRGISGLDADAIAVALDSPEVTEAYERDRAEARTAAGTAAETQGKTSTSDGAVRYTAPSVVFRAGGSELVAGGWQPLLAYDVLVTNLDPTLEVTSPPSDPLSLLEHFADGLATAEVAAVLADGPDLIPDLDGSERALLALAARRKAERLPLGQDALWRVM